MNRLLSVVVVVGVLCVGCSGDDEGVGLPADIPAPTTEPPTTTGALPQVPSTVPVVASTPTPRTDMEVLQAAQPTVEAWVELAWVEPAADPFGYDYSRWVDSLASLDADRGLLASDPPAVGFVEFNTNLNADGELRDKLTADMRSVLWLMSATGDGGDWRSPASDPEFAVVAASDATVEAAADAVSEQDLVAAPPVSLSGLGDPVVERDGSDRVVRVLWPVVIDVVVSHTDPDLGPGLARLRAGTTLELVEFGGSSTFLVRSAAAAGEFLYFLKSPVLDPAG